MEEIKDFNQRLLFIRKSYNFTKKQLADKLGINERTYQRLETGKSLPSYKTLNSSIEFFSQENSDYLLGCSDEPTGL